MLEVAFLAAHLIWMTTNRKIETFDDMITSNAARAMNVTNHQLQVGKNANLVVLEAPNVLEAVREHTAPRFVISNGKLVNRAKMEFISRTGD